MLVRCIPHLRRALPAVALLLALSGLQPASVQAQTAPAATPSAAGPGTADVFMVERVPVDVTADNAAVARDRGIAQAQRDGFAVLFDRLTADADYPVPPGFDPAAVEQAVDSFEVVGERSSAVRYVAEITVRYRPAAVRQLLAGQGVRFAEVKSKPVLILPVDMTGPEPVLWQTETPWRQAWEAFTPPVGLLPILVPYGELQDVTDIGVAEALAGDEAALRRIADRYGAGAVAVARIGLDGALTIPVFPDPNAPPAAEPLVTPLPADPAAPGPVPLVGPAPEAGVPPDPTRPRGVMAVVSLHRFQGMPEVLTIDLPPGAAGTGAAPTPTPAAPASTQADPALGLPAEGAAVAGPAPLPPGVAELMPVAVDRVADSLEQGWIRANLLDAGRQGTLVARVPLTGADQWMATRTRLSQVPTITRARVLTLSRAAAEVEIQYLGDEERLRTALAQRDLVLTPAAAATAGAFPAPATGPASPTGTAPWLLELRGTAAMPFAVPAAAPADSPGMGGTAPVDMPPADAGDVPMIGNPAQSPDQIPGGTP